MINSIHVRQCRKEAVVETGIFLGKGILFIIGSLGLGFIGAYGVYDCCELLKPWLESINTFLSILSFFLICVGVIGILGVVIISIHNLYKSNLEKCIERIKSEQKND